MPQAHPHFPAPSADSDIALKVPGSLPREAWLPTPVVHVLFSAPRGTGRSFMSGQPAPQPQAASREVGCGVVSLLARGVATARGGTLGQPVGFLRSLSWAYYVPWKYSWASVGITFGASVCPCGFCFISQVLQALTELQRGRPAAQEAAALAAPPWPRPQLAGPPSGCLTLPEPPSVKEQRGAHVFSSLGSGPTERGPFSCPVLSESRGLRGVMRTLSWTQDPLLLLATVP